MNFRCRDYNGKKSKINSCRYKKLIPNVKYLMTGNKIRKNEKVKYIDCCISQNIYYVMR